MKENTDPQVCVVHKERKEIVMENQYGSGPGTYEGNTNPYGSNYGNGQNTGPYGGDYGNGQNTGPYGGAYGNGQNTSPYGNYYGTGQNAGPYMNNTMYGGFGGGLGQQQPGAAVAAVRETERSFPFLFGTICYSLACVLSIASLFFPTVSDVYHMDINVQSVQIGSFVGCLLLGITVLGMWLFFASCAGSKPVPSTVGITLTRGVVITEIVLISIMIGIVAIVSCMLLFGASFLNSSLRYYSGDFTPMAMIGIVAVVICVVLAVCILMLIYQVKILKTTKVIRNTLRTGQVQGNVSMYHIVFNFIMVAFYVITIAGNFINTYYVASVVPAMIQSLLMIISYISITVSLLMLRSKFKMITDPFQGY